MPTLQAEPTEIKQRLARHYDADAVQYHVAHYRAPGPYSPLQQRQWYIEHMIRGHASPGARILDVGCGPGQLILSLLEQGYEARGVDISAGMVAEARDLLRRQGFASVSRVAVGDIERLVFENGDFDVVVASGVLEYQKTDDVALAELSRVLRPGGLLVINVSNRYAYVIWLDAAYRWLKRNKVLRGIASFLKRYVLRRGPLNDFPDHRTHVPAEFDDALARHGFRKLTYNYFHFLPVPMPLDSLAVGITRPIGRRMEALTKHALAPLLGGGYLVLAAKRRAEGHGRNGTAR